ncbi:MAG TPA: hypothetical protein VEC93_14505 [Anaerolineae bacterium]|nr:hypothetical protein [Anaerolineae bacterium]
MTQNCYFTRYSYISPISSLLLSPTLASSNNLPCCTPLPKEEGPVNSLAFSPDGHWLATASTPNTVRLWDVVNPSAKPVVLSGHEGPVSTLAFSSDGRWLATGSDDRTARLWNAAHPLAKVEDKQDVYELIGLARIRHLSIPDLKFRCSLCSFPG